MKPLQVEAFYLSEHETYDDVADDLPRFFEKVEWSGAGSVRSSRQKQRQVRVR